MAEQWCSTYEYRSEDPEGLKAFRAKEILEDLWKDLEKAQIAKKMDEKILNRYYDGLDKRREFKRRAEIYKKAFKIEQISEFDRHAVDEKLKPFLNSLDIIEETFELNKTEIQMKKTSDAVNAQIKSIVDTIEKQKLNERYAQSLFVPTLEKLGVESLYFGELLPSGDLDKDD